MLSLGLLLALGWNYIFKSMKLIAIANTVFLNYTAPTFATLLVSLFFQEKTGWKVTAPTYKSQFFIY